MLKSLWFAVFVALLSVTVSGPAQADPVADEWQAVISGQVEAFHAGDGATAIGFAASSFKRSFPDPDLFLEAIRQWGYGAIMDSRSHRFGRYQLVDPDTALQVVTFTGDDQLIYEALYLLQHEADGWRIGSVQLQRTNGVGV